MRDISIKNNVLKYKYIAFDKISSTQNVAKLLLERENTPLIIHGYQQLYGRGRYKKFWHSPLGNLYFSIILYNDDDIYATHLCFLTALAVRDAINYYISGELIEYKWPNDIMVEGKKLAGILIESINEYVIIGIGVNIISYPKIDSLQLATLGNFTKKEIDINSLLSAIINQFDYYLSLLSSQGFAKIRKLWLKNAYKLNQEISFNIPIGNSTSTIKGKFCGITDDGDIIIENNFGTNIFYLGEIL